MSTRRENISQRAACCAFPLSPGVPSTAAFARGASSALSERTQVDLWQRQRHVLELGLHRGTCIVPPSGIQVPRVRLHDDSSDAVRLLAPDDSCLETISRALVSEVVNALPDGPLRSMLIPWTAGQDWSEQSSNDLNRLADELAGLAHTTEQEAGEVGLQREAAAGQVVGADPAALDTERVSSLALLALALRRLLCFHHVQTRLQARSPARE